MLFISLSEALNLHTSDAKVHVDIHMCALPAKARVSPAPRGEYALQVKDLALQYCTPEYAKGSSKE